MGFRYATNTERLQLGLTGSVIEEPVEEEGSSPTRQEAPKPKARKAPRRSPKPKPVHSPEPVKPANGHPVAVLTLAKGDKFPENPQRFDQVIDQKGDTWVFDLPRDPQGRYMGDDPATKEHENPMDWFPRDGDE